MAVLEAVTSAMELNFIDRAELPNIWSVVRNDILKAVDYSRGRYNEKAIVDGLITGAMQLWVLFDDEIKMSMITQIMTYPTGLKVCEVTLLGGLDSKEWVNFVVGELDKWAVSLGCHSLQIIGRPGWEKVLKNWGKIAVMLERPLGEYYGR